MRPRAPAPPARSPLTPAGGSEVGVVARCARRYFREFMEDYNTATMPHRKYYEYEKWEVEDYEKRQRRDAKRKGRVQTEFNDEVSPPRAICGGCRQEPRGVKRRVLRRRAPRRMRCTRRARRGARLTKRRR